MFDHDDQKPQELVSGEEFRRRLINRVRENRDLRNSINNILRGVDNSFSDIDLVNLILRELNS